MIRKSLSIKSGSIATADSFGDFIEKWIISLKKDFLMKKSLADFLLGLQDWEEIGWMPTYVPAL